ncbi:MAG: cytochrome c [Vicinamibacterales bacterium]
MKRLLIALALVPAFAVAAPAIARAQDAPKGDPAAGARAYSAKLCRFCHGDDLEGGFGMDLAGRNITYKQFLRAIRQPWSLMPQYNENQVSPQMAADLYAFIKSKPAGKEPGHWHWPQPPASAPLGQRIYINVGCGQCHEPENKFARMWLGEHAKEVNWEYFKKQIYQHTAKWPRGSMGDYNPDRLPEIMLKEIYQFLVVDLGVRASIGGAITVAEQAGGNTTYKLTVSNRGVKDSGATAEGLTVFVRIPEGTKVVSGTGPGYKGSQSLKSLGLEPGLAVATHPNEKGETPRPPADLSGDVVVWKLPKLVAADKVELSFTLPGAPNEALVKAMDGSTVHWEKPGRTPFGQKLAYRDTRTPDKGDHERLGLPRLP